MGLLAAYVVVVAPSVVTANHAICYDSNQHPSQIEYCSSSKRSAANTACYENNSGNNDAIAECVRQVDAHFTSSENPLPADAQTESSGNSEGDCKGGDLNKDNCAIVYYIVQFTNILSGLVGIVIVIMIAYGGIQYSASKDNPQEAAAAKDKIRNAVIALVFYIFVFALLQYLIPGGVLSS